MSPVWGLEAEPALAAQRPVDAAAGADDAGHLAAELLFEGAGPGNEAETQAIVDHGEAAGGEREALTNDAGDLLAGRSRAVCKPGLARDLRADGIQLALAQRVEHSALEHRALAEATRQPLADEMISARVHRTPHLRAESTVRDTGAALNEAMVEPGRAGRLHLRGEVEIRSRGEDQRRLRLTGLADAAQFDDAAELWAMLQRLDAGQSDMVGAAVSAVDHGIGRAGQLVVQTLVDQPAGDRLHGRAAHDGVAVERPIVALVLKRPADGTDDVTARGQLAQLRLRAFGHRPLARFALGRETHRFQMLQPTDHQPAELRIVRTGPLGAQVDHAQLVGRAADLHVQPG